MNSLEGKTVLITGSSSGIGLATARLAKQRGAIVIVHCKDDCEDLHAIAAELEVEKVVFDVSIKSEVVEGINKIVEKHGKINVLVNNAGINVHREFLGISEEDWEKVLGVNLVGVSNCCQAVLPSMVDQKGGAIVNVSSIRGFFANSSGGNLPYSISKAGVMSLTSGLAKQYGPEVRVNCVAPGPTDTAMVANWDSETRKKYEENSIVKRLAEPEEIAEVILFLASNESSIMTGQILTADGGYTIYGK